MDPNLEKIRDFHIEEINSGDLDRALAEAKDYLMYIHGHNFAAMNVEFKTFKKNIQGK